MIRVMTFRFALAFAMAPMIAAAQSAPLSIFSDPGSGVSFHYPSQWKKVPRQETYIPPYLLQEGLNPVVDVEFSPKGSPYEKTNLAGLDFVYATAPAASVADCYKLGEIDMESAQKDVIQLRGIVYQHASGDGVAMCHQIQTQIYSTYREGICHLFEQDMMTFCAGALEGTRGLTAKQINALQHQLGAIMQSVTFGTQR
jgi:hypothetical protein